MSPRPAPASGHEPWDRPRATILADPRPRCRSRLHRQHGLPRARAAPGRPARRALRLRLRQRSQLPPHDRGYRLAFCRDAISVHRWREGLRRYLRQQFGVGYGRLDLVARHPRRIDGDDVSGTMMMLHGPAMLFALAAPGIASIRCPGPWTQRSGARFSYIADHRGAPSSSVWQCGRSGLAGGRGCRPRSRSHSSLSFETAPGRRRSWSGWRRCLRQARVAAPGHSMLPPASDGADPSAWEPRGGGQSRLSVACPPSTSAPNLRASSTDLRRVNVETRPPDRERCIRPTGPAICCRSSACPG